MTFNPATPNASDLISATQQPIKDNFNQLNAQFGIDHVPFNNGGVNGTGLHKQVTFTAPTAPAAPGATVGIDHTVLGTGGANSVFFNNIALPFFRNSVDDLALTPNIIRTTAAYTNASSIDYTFKLGKVIFNMGSITINGVANNTYNYGTAFTTETMTFQIRAINSGAVPSVLSNSLSGFNLNAATLGPIVYYYLAIGY